VKLVQFVPSFYADVPPKRAYKGLTRKSLTTYVVETKFIKDYFMVISI
jgi:hypothetical protein